MVSYLLIVTSYHVKWRHSTRHLGSAILDFTIFLKCQEIMEITTKSSQNALEKYKLVNLWNLMKKTGEKIQIQQTARLKLHEIRFETPNMTITYKAGSQQWTAVSSLLGLISTVYRRYVTPALEPTHIECKVTRSLYQGPYFEPTRLLPETRVATARVSVRKETKKDLRRFTDPTGTFSLSSLFPVSCLGCSSVRFSGY